MQVHRIEPVVAEIVWAVDRVSRRMPEQLACLPRGLAVCEMMLRRGISAHLEIGVARDERNRFMAHAWVVHRGNVIIGGVPNLDRYAKLSGWPTGRRKQASGARVTSDESSKRE
ncbi:MAG: lasso peptide biosynthesis B2 protein [Polyangiaceae bacterium]